MTTTMSLEEFRAKYFNIRNLEVVIWVAMSERGYTREEAIQYLNDMCDRQYLDSLKIGAMSRKEKAEYLGIDESILPPEEISGGRV